MRNIIGITGKLGSGKNYIVNNIVIPVLKRIQNERYLEIAFADQIKINVMSKNGINYSDVYECKTQESRQLLQNEGTEIGRTLDKNIWVKYLDNWITINNSRGVCIFIISDCRFMNEFSYIKDSGGIIIKVVSNSRNNLCLLKESKNDINILNKISTHRSECDLDNLRDDDFNLIINNEIDMALDIKKLQDKFEQLYYDLFTVDS